MGKIKSSLLGQKRKKSDSSNNENSSESSSYSMSSEKEVESLMKKQLNNNKRSDTIPVINMKNGTPEDVAVKNIESLYKKNDTESLDNYSFPYMSQNQFNRNFLFIQADSFRKLSFYCPLCKKDFKHYSMYYHIFQVHFNSINQFLSEREIANSCAKLMNNEYKKINNSLKLFTELAILYKSCNFAGGSEWKDMADKQIEKLKNLNINKTYFMKNLDEVKKLLSQSLPLNKNKNNTKKRTFKKKNKS